MSEGLNNFTKFTTYSGKPLKILVVDDDESIRSMLVELLKSLKCIVYSAGNGKKALEIYQNQRNFFDLVILDFQMPVMNGKIAFEKIRKINPTQKILMISGAENDRDLKKIIIKDHVHFLSKPFQIDDIVEELNVLLDNQLPCSDQS